MGAIKSFFLKQALKLKMKDAPEAEREKMLGLMEQNPEIFKKIGDEVKKKMKGGLSETAATMVVMREYQGELQKLMK